VEVAFGGAEETFIDKGTVLQGMKSPGFRRSFQQNRVFSVELMMKNTSAT
jgi:hypothetical protein